MAIKLILLVAFFALMVFVGIKTRNSAASVEGFVLGGGSVGPWVKAFAVAACECSGGVFVVCAGEFGW